MMSSHRHPAIKCHQKAINKTSEFKNWKNYTKIQHEIKRLINSEVYTLVHRTYKHVSFQLRKLLKKLTLVFTHLKISNKECFLWKPVKIKYELEKPEHFVFSKKA